MFDSSLPGPAVLAEVSDAELIDAILGWSAAAAAAEARKFAALAEWHRRASTDPQRERAACDDLDNAAAQVAAALTIPHGRALGWMDTAVVLRDRLPKLGRLFLAGQVSERVVARIVWLSGLVVDDTVWAALDEQFAAAATSWGQLSGAKLDTAIEVWLQLHDPDAIRRVRAQLRSRDFQIGKHDDATGTASVWGRVHSVDAAIAVARIRTMVDSVCDNDPRTLAQKRADAFGAVFAGVRRPACLCGTPGAPPPANPDGRAASVVVHVVADRRRPRRRPRHRHPRRGTRRPPHLSLARDRPPAPGRRPAAGHRPHAARSLPGAPLLAGLIARGAKVRFVAGPESLPACPGYRPSAALDEFVRARDLTCRLPGCDRPAMYADIDHIDPWPGGPTHPGNLGCKCRLHHLLKTFYGGWHEQQLPDGTLHITTPTGHTYTTRPFSALLFPSWTTTTDPPPPRPRSSPPPPRPDGVCGCPPADTPATTPAPPTSCANAASTPPPENSTASPPLKPPNNAALDVTPCAPPTRKQRPGPTATTPHPSDRAY